MENSFTGKKVHFIGIGGVGMSATAKLLQDSGAMVSGSDEEVYPPISTFLEESKLSYTTPYKAENIPENVDCIVIGKNAKLIRETNKEVAAAYASGKEILSFPDVLARLSQDKETIIVAGSYGKSTCTALLAHCLIEAGLDPSFFIGAVPYSPRSSAAFGEGPLFILEGDEYPSSNTDPRSKFLLLNPKNVLLSPLAHDHINVFPTSAEYVKPFEELVSMVPKSGTVVICAEGELSEQLLKGIERPHVTYGLSRGEFQATAISWGEKTKFSVVRNGSTIVELETSLLGEHNIQNIVGVAAFVFSKNLMEPEQFARGVLSFKGIHRRLDRKSQHTTLPIYEGFGSSYEKAQSAIAAMKKHFPNKRLLVVFEPNTITWRSRASLPDYDTAFLGASLVYVYNPPHDGKETQLSLEEIVARIAQTGIETIGTTDAEETLSMLEKELMENDAILISSSGAMGGLPERIPLLAEKLFPKKSV